MLRKKTCISEPTINIIEDRRAARLRGDKPEVKRLTKERNHALGLDQGRYWDAKAAAIESAVARQDQHTVFRELRTCKQPGTGCSQAPTEVPRTRAASASREHCATLPVGPSEGRRAIPGGQPLQ